MRVPELLKKKAGKPVISFELSRPKTDKAAASLETALGTLEAAQPDYVSVTFGAGGSNRDGSYQLIDKLKNERHLPVVGYLAAVGLGPEDLESCLDKFKALGLETLFIIRGDAPTWDETYKPHPKALSYASDLVTFVKQRHDFSLGAAAYPEGHLEAKSLEQDLEYVKLKQDSGAEYLVAQYFYDNDYFYRFVDKCGAAGITLPIIPGIMPIYTVKLMENLARLCGATVTDVVRDGLAKLPPDDKGAVGQLGIDLATRQCRDLLAHGVTGLHFYTMNRAKAVSTILGTLRGEGLL